MKKENDVTGMIAQFDPKIYAKVLDWATRVTKAVAERKQKEKTLE
jgi:hypothetical protein